PHHGSSTAGIVGSVRGPGELSLAHRGLLFLDELPEFDRRSLEALRQPLEGGVVILSMARGRVALPARFQLVAAMNPCPCGFDGDPDRPCGCHPSDRRRYRGRLSGPLLDRFEVRVTMGRRDGADDGRVADADAPRSARVGAEPSAAVATRVARARAIALRRQRVPNAALAGPALASLALDADARDLLAAARQRTAIGERGVDQVVRVARTIADLAGAEAVMGDHLVEALAFRARPWHDDDHGERAW
nr:ATP-binding protein [Trueperaceae bacterium]